ncbi:MAG TPA: biotin carboxylase N-terminal domain-containing protein [Fimbriimonadaceae bacterium]|nr:biotin carboxylase N-terminal domain-containing protein [Fimbriimonadaceae bacterium]
MIKKLLIANRGEIAVRVIRAAREMGIRTVAVYSDADAHQMHVALADEAVGLGAPESSASYLDMKKVIEAAKATSADAIHPGYGFLSERAEFSRACDEAGIVFIGPPAAAMEKLGSKIEAKQLAVRVGVPVTPGYFESGASVDQLRDAAARVGFPIMLKASAGGGGRGMRVVREPEAFDEELAIASDEALKAFGDGEMMIEKLIERPRHIEVQVLADKHGNVACLFERECSIQRRHQKLIEEAPSVCASADLWTRMQAAVRALVVEAGYHGAGTVEFMFDEASGEFYFLEVNARLQVEHPVTEMITGLDLVQWQIRIASGEPLAIPSALMSGDRGAINGHAIEARIVAEDPAASFMPSIGRILAWAEPKRPGIRVDTGYGPDAEIPRYYDSLIAKVIAHGETRDQALARLEAALLDFHVLGVKTNIAYLVDVIRHEGFREGRFDTGFLGREFASWHPDVSVPPELIRIADQAGQTAAVGGLERDSGVWDLADGFRISGRPS